MNSHLFGTPSKGNGTPSWGIKIRRLCRGSHHDIRFHPKHAELDIWAMHTAADGTAAQYVYRPIYCLLGQSTMSFQNIPFHVHLGDPTGNVDGAM